MTPTNPSTHQFRIGELPVGGGAPPVFICGPCVIESPEHTLKMALALAEIAARLRAPIVFKASYDKANRSSHESYRGPGLKRGLEILAEAKRESGLPLLTDIHERDQIGPVAEVVDIIQIPAFLCRQTDLVMDAGRSGRPVNVKKGQFMAPEDMLNVVRKLEEVGCRDILLTDRGTSFGYRMLVSDFRALPIMRGFGYPVCYDATHSVQMPGGLGEASGGRSEMIPYLARAAVAVGVDALFVETHDNPPKALSDGPNQFPLDRLEALIRTLRGIDGVVRDSD